MKEWQKIWMMKRPLQSWIIDQLDSEGERRQ